MLRRVPIFSVSLPWTGTAVRWWPRSRKWWLPRTRSSVKPCCCKKRTISLPVGRGSLVTGELGEVPVKLPDRRRTDPGQRVGETKRLDVAADGFLQVRDGRILGLSLAVGGDVGDAGGEAALLRIGDQFHRDAVEGLAILHVGRIAQKLPAVQ